MRFLPVFLFLLGLQPNFVQAQAALQIPLWPNGAPGFESRRNEPEQAKDWWVKSDRCGRAYLSGRRT